MPIADDQVGVVDGVVAVHPAVHAQEAERQRVVSGKPQMPEQRGHDRDLRLFGEARAARPRRLESSTPWPAMMTGRWACSISRAALRTWRMLRLERRLVAGQVDLVGIAGVDLGQQDVLRARRRGPGRAGRCGRGGTLRCMTRGRSLRVADEVVLLGDRDGDAGDVGFLEGVRADHAVGHVGRDRDQRRRVHVRVADARDQVGRARAAGAEAHADRALSCGLRCAAARRSRRPCAPAPCSWRTRMWCSCGNSGSTSYSGMMAPPGSPKMRGHALFHERLTDCSCTVQAHGCPHFS